MSGDYNGQAVELEVARYGLRTFRHIPAEQAVMTVHSFAIQQMMRDLGLHSDGPDVPMELCSTAMQGSHWKGGVCEATCQAQRNTHRERLIELAALTVGEQPVFSHQAPHEDCHCGIYAAHTLRTLKEQFAAARDIVAVVAAEGQTIIGSKGFRTQRARVVAYWCSESVSATASTQFAQAQRYSTISSMLDDYGLDEGSSSPPEPYWPSASSALSAMQNRAILGGNRSPFLLPPLPLFTEETVKSPRTLRRGKAAGASVNFAACALNSIIGVLCHSWWCMGFGAVSLVAAVSILMLVDA